MNKNNSCEVVPLSTIIKGIKLIVVEVVPLSAAVKLMKLTVVEVATVATMINCIILIVVKVVYVSTVIKLNNTNSCLSSSNTMDITVGIIDNKISSTSAWELIIKIKQH